MEDTSTIDVAAIAAKVAALLAKAEDPASTPAEKHLFAEKAMELMVKYEIDSMTLDAGKNGEVPIVFGQFRIHTHEDDFVPFERIMLAGSIARNFECKTVIHRYHGMTRDFDGASMIPPGVYYEAVGYKGDFEMVAVMYYHLSQFLMARILLETQKMGKVKKDEKVRWERSVAQGFVDVIDERLKAMHGRVSDWSMEQGLSSSTAVAIRSRLERVQEKFMEKYPPGTLGSLRGSQLNVNMDAYNKGARLGREADLGGGSKLGAGNGKALGR